VPIVSYIQPYSPLRKHISVGDIIIAVNGRSVTNFNHIELCSLLNGGSSRNCDNGANQGQRQLTKLVFLPGKYHQKHHHVEQEKLNESTGTDDSARRFSSTASLTETTANSARPTLTLSDECHRDHIDDSFPRMSSSDQQSSLQQQPPKREEEGTSCAKSVTPPSCSSLPSTSSSFSQESIVTNGYNIIFQQGHEYKHSKSQSSPMTAVTSTSLTTTSSSSNCSTSSIVSKGSNGDVGSDDIARHTYPDEILRTNMEISFRKKVDVDVASTSRGSIPFLDYLEKKVGELNEMNKSELVSVGNRTRSPQRNGITHPLSPISSQSVAAAETETIRRLRREVLGLFLTLDRMRRNSQEWMLLKSRLDVAREELNAVLEDQYIVRSISSGDSVAPSSKSSTSEKLCEELLATIPALPLTGAETKGKVQDDKIDRSTVDVMHLHYQQKCTDTRCANGSAEREENDENEPTHSQGKDDEGGVNEEREETVVKDCINEDDREAMARTDQQQFKSVQVQDGILEERMNRCQPRIESLSVTVSNKSEFDSDISTLYGGIWSREFNCTAHRVEDTMMICMEEGEPDKHMLDSNTYSRQQLMNRGANLTWPSQAHMTTVKTQQHYLIIEQTLLLTLIIMGAIGLVVFVFVVLIGD
jgi:hypothetical protein